MTSKELARGNKAVADQESQTNFLESYKYTIKNYINFSGRASRREYWTFVLMNWGIIFAITLVENMLSSSGSSEEGLFSTIFYLFTIVPTIAVGVRRMHDRGKSGFWLLIPIVNLLLAIEKGEEGDNEYGTEMP